MGMSRSVMTTFWSLGSRCCHHEIFPSLPWSNLHEHESSPPIGLLMAILLSARPLEFSASGFRYPTGLTLPTLVRIRRAACQTQLAENQADSGDKLVELMPPEICRLGLLKAVLAVMKTNRALIDQP